MACFKLERRNFVMAYFKYEELTDRMPFAVIDPNGKEYHGEFTNLRVERESLPKGKFAYDLRHDDECGGNICELANYILVNHMGTFISDEEIPFPDEGYIIFSDEEGEWDYTFE